MRAVAIDLDGALGDTRPLWREFLTDAARRYAAIAPLDVDGLPSDRGEAAAVLDDWASRGVGDWRGALARFAEERAPVFLRPSADAGAALRALSDTGCRVGVYTDAPEELARIALAHLGAARRVDFLETGARACERLLERLGQGAAVVVRRDELVRLAAANPTTRRSSRHR